MKRMGRMMLQADPTSARIRETRHQISERFGHDPQKLVAYYIGLQKKYQDRVVGETTYTIQGEGADAPGDAEVDLPRVLE
jgi:hypothetical protein